jgi:hypothetical protein
MLSKIARSSDPGMLPPLVDPAHLPETSAEGCQMERVAQERSVRGL